MAEFWYSAITLQLARNIVRTGFCNTRVTLQKDTVQACAFIVVLSAAAAALPASLSQSERNAARLRGTRCLHGPRARKGDKRIIMVAIRMRATARCSMLHSKLCAGACHAALRLHAGTGASSGASWARLFPVGQQLTGFKLLN